jgi:hypothetical protein
MEDVIEAGGRMTELLGSGLAFFRTRWDALLLDALLTILILYPLIDHLTYGWARKANEINSSLGPDAKRAYLAIFQKKTVSNDEAEAEFDRMFRQWYGRWRFAGPVGLVLLGSLIGNFLLGSELIRLASSPPDFGTAPAAIAGAYTFVAWNFFSQMQRRNVSVADVMRGALRLAVAIPVGYAFGQLLNPGLSPFIALAVGAFPLNAIGTMLRQLEAPPRFAPSSTDWRAVRRPILENSITCWMPRLSQPASRSSD